MSLFYDAHPLKYGASTNIRLIEILHDNSPDASTPIKCKLRFTTLDDAEHYKALSYVWGSDAVIKFIILDGQPFPVRENLWNFLAQYRSSGDQGSLWIDAICIDQNCIEERNHQVAMMGQIYSGAKLVIVWLGLRLEDPISALEKLSEPSEDLTSWMTNVRRVGDDEYWGRVWIIQEFVLARALDIWAGTRKINGHLFTTQFDSGLYFRITSHPDSDVDLFNQEIMRMKRSTMYAVIECRRDHQLQGVWHDTYMLFGKFQSVKCSDTRDRVYGLLGLIDPDELGAFPIRPDYSKSTSMLFMELWERWFEGNSSVLANSLSWYILEKYTHYLQTLLDLDNDDKVVLEALEKCNEGLQNAKAFEDARSIEMSCGDRKMSCGDRKMSIKQEAKKKYRDYVLQPEWVQSIFGSTKKSSTFTTHEKR
jgi:hypothetical protein